MVTPVQLLVPLLFLQDATAPYTPPPLPPVPLLERWVLENPWPPVIGLAAAGVVVFFILNARGGGGARQGALAAGALALVAALCVVTSFLVTTQREVLVQRTRELVAAAAQPDLRALAPMLAEDVGLRVLGRAYTEDKAGIVGLVDRYIGSEYRVTRHSVPSVTAHTDDGGAGSAGAAGGRTLARVRVEVDGMTNRSWWRLTWRRSGVAAGEWTVVHIEGLQIDFVGSEQMPR